MNNFSFNTAPAIRMVDGGAGKMGELLKDGFLSDKASIMFITDPGIMRLGLADAALANLRSQGYDVTLFDEVEPDPGASTVQHVTALVKNKGIEGIVGFGGGSSMDVAKVVALLGNSKQTLDELYGVNQARGKRLLLILVPTTAGTGSEVTPVAILTTGSEEKKGVVSSLILPDLALLDPELTLALPPHITAATGIDAMVHAIEAYTSKNANNNPVSRQLAKHALQLLGSNIREAVFNGGNKHARANMLLGSMLAGQAFANSPVAAVHALAYPVGSLFHVPHGLSNALVLPAVMRFNASVCARAYAELAPYIFTEILSSQSAEEVSAELIDRLAKLIVELGLESGLLQVGIKEGDVPKLAEDAMKQTRLLVNNQREMTFEAALDIYRASL